MALSCSLSLMCLRSTQRSKTRVRQALKGLSNTRKRFAVAAFWAEEVSFLDKSEDYSGSSDESKAHSKVWTNKIGLIYWSIKY
jgi:hypothetical protein